MTTKFCVECGDSIREKAHVCPKCGCDQANPPTNGNKHCAECGESVRAKAVICPHCGCSLTRSEAGGSSGDDVEKPGKVLAMGIMAVGGGCFAIAWSLGWMCLTFGVACAWPGLYYGFVMAIFAIIDGSALLGSNSRNQLPPARIGIMQIITIINLDVVNVVLGIVTLVFCKDKDVQEYLARK